MTDREKVIKGLELCLTPTDRREYNDADVCHTECPYFRAYNMGDCIRALAKDALTLLKAQEPVAPIQDADDKEDDIFRCGACGAVVGETFLGPPGECEVRHNYCPECGKAVKW